jgi:hypothetical protein
MLEDEVENEVPLVSPYLRTGRRKQMRRETLQSHLHLAKGYQWNSPG